jgi:hypothetical protein
MSIHTVWQSLDAKLQEKFHGKFCQMAFREAFIVAGMFYAHRYLKLNLHPNDHAALDRAWYGSLAPNHPMHALRSSVQTKIGNLAEAADDHFGSPIQRKFAVFDTLLVPPLSALNCNAQNPIWSCTNGKEVHTSVVR